jgi:hypothetical protein
MTASSWSSRAFSSAETPLVFKSLAVIVLIVL